VVRRPNHRGRPVAFPLGLAILTTGLMLGAIAAAIQAITGVLLLQPEDGRWIVFVTGVSLLGLLDDLLGSGDEAPRGWRGHLAAARTGRLSTGAIKALGTAALALMAASGLPGSPADGLVAAGILALATNLGNLLDLRPGRAEKALALVIFAVCAAELTASLLRLLWFFLIPVAAGAWLTLRERAMLGDTGAHLVGALIGIALVTGLPLTAACVALAALVAITIFGEFRSISAAIERLPPFKQLDSLGRVR
jgi:UDP-GlcNAc:undecaprenyl-phosphate/decaprenyl-phosphate GlcNAc-1-phosphate transferase